MDVPFVVSGNFVRQGATEYGISTCLQVAPNYKKKVKLSHKNYAKQGGLSGLLPLGFSWILDRLGGWRHSEACPLKGHDTCPESHASYPHGM
jgi:hypothetical protein